MKIIETKIGELGAVLTAYIQEPSREMANVAKKPAVLIFPGGAYMFCSDREAEPIALAYLAEGFQAFVLRYSVGKNAIGCQPLQEASDAIALIRNKSEEWFVKQDQIAVCGFSAGGHLASWVSLSGESKPNATILGYGATRLATPNEEKHFIAKLLLGEDYTPEDAKKVDLALHVSNDSPPMFAWSTAEDVLVDVRSVLAMSDAYAAAGRPFELHIFQNGEHGLSLAKPITAYGRIAMADAHVAAWHSMSVEWLWRQFGRPSLKDKPYEKIPGLIPDME
ncbi:MAG: hypothetical protein PWP10_4572 [Clostridiales bacterium]|jgi:acetyl esterase/lipase|nr:hypothetical protein [Clostridiales bacterium]